MRNNTLRSSLIRLAAARPELRAHLLPLLKQADTEPEEKTADMDKVDEPLDKTTSGPQSG